MTDPNVATSTQFAELVNRSPWDHEALRDALRNLDLRLAQTEGMAHGHCAFCGKSSNDCHGCAESDQALKELQAGIMGSPARSTDRAIQAAWVRDLIAAARDHDQWRVTVQVDDLEALTAHLESPAAPQVAGGVDGDIADIVRRVHLVLSIYATNCDAMRAWVPGPGSVGISRDEMGALCAVPAQLAAERARRKSIEDSLDVTHAIEEISKTPDGALIVAANEMRASFLKTLYGIIPDTAEGERDERWDVIQAYEDALKRIGTEEYRAQRMGEAPTPAAPCADNSKLVDDMLRRVSTVEHCGEDHVALEDVRVLLGRALALAETKAVEKPRENPTDYPVPFINALQDKIHERFSGIGGGNWGAEATAVRITLWGYEHLTGIRLSDLVAKAVES